MNDELKQQSNYFQTEICLLHNVFQANLPESDDFTLWPTKPSPFQLRTNAPLI